MEPQAKSHGLVRAALILLLAVILGLSAVMIWVQFRASREAAQIQALRTAHVVATQYGWILQTSSQALQRIENAISHQIPPMEERRDIGEAVSGLPHGLQYSVYNATGHLIFTSVATDRDINVSDRDYFKRAAAGEELTIEPMLVERVSGEKVFIVARRIDDIDGFGGVATIAIPVQSLTELASVLDFPEGSTISLIRSDGMILARAPPIEPVSLSKTPQWAISTSADNGTYPSVSPADGTKRLVGFWKLDDWPVIAVAGISDASINATFARSFRDDLLVLLPLGAALGVMTVWLFRLLRIDDRRATALQISNERSTFLMKEMQHRVKNNLQSVMSLVRLQRLPEDVTSALLGRISAMVEIHREMYSNETKDSIGTKSYLTRIIQNIARSQGDKVKITSDIVDVGLSSERAMQLGLLTNEILANANKHAFKDRGDGHVDVRLEAVGEGQLRLTVQDNGPGMDVQNAQPNMGSKLVAGFVAQMGGKLTLQNENGLRVTIDFPLESSGADDQVLS